MKQNLGASTETGFVADFRKIVLNNLKLNRATFNPSDDTYRLLLNYIQLADKMMIGDHNRKVHFSQEITESLETCTKSVQLAVNDLKTRIENGEDLLPYMSRKVRNANKPSADMLVRNWRIYHAHIDAPADDKKLANRSDNLLFFTLDDDNAYFLDIIPHPKGNNWFRTRFLEIIYDNHWKHLLNVYPGAAGVSPNLTEEEINRAMKSSVFGVQVRDCVVFPADLGVASSGDNNMAVKTADRIYGGLQKWQKWLETVRANPSISKGFSRAKDLRLYSFDANFFFVYDLSSKETTRHRIDYYESPKPEDLCESLIFSMGVFRYFCTYMCEDDEHVVVLIDEDRSKNHTSRRLLQCRNLPKNPAVKTSGETVLFKPNF